MVSTTSFLNSGVYRLFGTPFGIKITPPVKHYIILSNKWGAVHFWLVFSQVNFTKKGLRFLYHMSDFGFSHGREPLILLLF